MEQSFLQSNVVRILAALEATTLATLVLIAVPIQFLYHEAVFVHIVGAIHGMIFLTYIWTVFHLAATGELSTKQTLRLTVYACIPLCGFLSFILLSKTPRLADQSLRNQ